MKFESKYEYFLSRKCVLKERGREERETGERKRKRERGHCAAIRDNKAGIMTSQSSVYDHNKTKHNKTVCIFQGVYCILRYASNIVVLEFLRISLCNVLRAGGSYFNSFVLIS